MFGYIQLNKQNCALEDKKTFSYAYCGLCHSLRNNYSFNAQFTLSYDLTFVSLLLSDIYQMPEEIEKERCALHLIKPHHYFVNEAINYACDMNVLLAYYDLLDDYQDDHNQKAQRQANKLSNQITILKQKYPQKVQIIEAKLAQLNQYEQSGEINPDVCAECFGELFQEVFVIKEDQYSDKLRNFGNKLGKLVYLLDAYNDLKSDLKKELFNPLVSVDSLLVQPMLDGYGQQVVEALKALPIDKHRAIMENVIYSGIWTKIEIKKEAHRL